jgi:hypothetical protein
MKTVKITNITHQSGRGMTVLDLYGQCILPGEFIFIPEISIDEKVMAHQKIGHIAIGELPKSPAPSQADIIKKMQMEYSNDPQEKTIERTSEVVKKKKV